MASIGEKPTKNKKNNNFAENIQKLPNDLKLSFEKISPWSEVSVCLLECFQDLSDLSSSVDWDVKIDKLYDFFNNGSIDENAKLAIYDFLLYFANIKPRNYYPSSMQNNPSNVPAEFRIVTSNQFAYDIRELLKNPKILDISLIDPITNKPFNVMDQMRIFNQAFLKRIAVDFVDTKTVNSIEKKQGHAGLKTENYFVVNSKTGEVNSFDVKMIEKNIISAYKAVRGGSITEDKLNAVLFRTFVGLKERYPFGGILHDETIQELVESAMVSCGDYDVSQSSVVYRAERRKARASAEAHYEPSIRVLMPNKQLRELDKPGLLEFLKDVSKDCPFVDVKMILNDTYRNLYDKIPYNQVNEALIMSARSFIERDPSYSTVASRILKHRLCEEVIGYFEKKPVQLKQSNFAYNTLLDSYITKGLELGFLDKRVSKFNRAKLAKAIDCSRDDLLNFMSLQNLYDRYFLHDKNVHIELPQLFFMRVAMGVALEENNPTEEAIKFYNKISTLRYMPSTPTLFNSATAHPQLSSCFLNIIPDDLDGIFTSVKDNAISSKWSGGISNSATLLRANGSKIKGTNGTSSGVVPFLKILDSTAIAVNQGGKRKGAIVTYLESWHLDIEDFLDLRKNSGDDRRRTHDMNTANWIPDLFMKRVMSQSNWTLFSPDETPMLHDTYGKEFEKLYEEYEIMAEAGIIRSKKIPATVLWRKMLTALFETGHPWVTFKDPCNIRSPQKHCGVVHCSNLCTEITLNTSFDEIAVCNLGSLVIPRHFVDKKLDWDMLKDSIYTAIRMLDNIIDINYYAVDKGRNSNLKHRPIGLGLMGFQDALYLLGIPYDSQEAVNFADELMEFISFHAINASIDLAKERGTYVTYHGSSWSKGILPIDSIKYLSEERGGNYLDQDQSMRMDWQVIRDKLSIYGIRNSNLMAIAPTATISNIANTSQSIEPCYMNLQVKSNISGEFTVINPYLVNELKELGLWDDLMSHELKRYEGSVQKIDRVPDHIKNLYKTAFEIDPIWLIEAASRRQKWIDQAQSLNLYMSQASGKKLDQLYKHAWLKGLKTTYYLRTLGATVAEKSTISDGSLNLVSPALKKACAIDEPDCEACQ